MMELEEFKKKKPTNPKNGIWKRNPDSVKEPNFRIESEAPRCYQLLYESKVTYSIPEWRKTKPLRRDRSQRLNFSEKSIQEQVSRVRYTSGQLKTGLENDEFHDPLKPNEIDNEMFEGDGRGQSKFGTSDWRWGIVMPFCGVVLTVTHLRNGGWRGIAHSFMDRRWTGVTGRRQYATGAVIVCLDGGIVSS